MDEFFRITSFINYSDKLPHVVQHLTLIILTMKKLFLYLILITLLTGNVFANKRTECLRAVEKGKEIMNINDMKVYSYNGKTYTFRDKSNRCFERALR
jgi:hypothetical protein